MQGDKGGHVKTEAEIGIMQPQGKEDQGPPKAGGGKAGYPQGLSEGVPPADTSMSDFWPPEL